KVVGAELSKRDVPDMVCGDCGIAFVTSQGGRGAVTALTEMGEPAPQKFTGAVPVRIADPAQLALLRHARGVRLGRLLGREVALRRARLSAHAWLPPTGLPANRPFVGGHA